MYGGISQMMAITTRFNTSVIDVSVPRNNRYGSCVFVPEAEIWEWSRAPPSKGQ